MNLRDANPVPRDRFDGWSRSAEGRATRQRVLEAPAGSPRRARPTRTVAVAAALVLALVASVLVLRRGGHSTTPAARRSVVDRLAHGEWKTLDAGPAAGLRGARAIWTGNEYLVWSGGGGAALPAGAAFNPRTGTWRTIDSSQFTSPRSGAFAVRAGDTMLVWGGLNEGSSAMSVDFSNGARYHPATDQWSYVRSAPFAPTEGTTATWTGHELVVTNGYPERCLSVDASTCTSDVASYDPKTDTWEALPDPPISLRGKKPVLATWTGHEIVYVLPSGTVAERAAVAFDPKSRTWRQIPVPFAQDVFGTVGLVRDRRSAVYVEWPGAGGSTDGELRWARLDVARGEWVPGPRDYPHPSICSIELSPVPSGAAVFCDVRHLIGVDFAHGTWHAFPRPPGQLPRSVAWTGHELLAFTGTELLALQPAAR